MHFLPSVFDGNLEHYFSVIRGGIAVRSHYDLLNWLQGEMQRYLPHKIMLAVWVDGDANRVEYDVVSTLPGVRTGSIHAEKLFSLQRELYSVWLELGHVPYRRSLGARNFRTGNCSPSCLTGAVFRGMRSLLVHGVSDERTGQDCLYIIFNSQDSFDDTALGVMENLLPYLDTALRRITPLNHQHQVVLSSADLPYSRKNYGLSAREAEIMNWVRLGKTNAEIATILDISACTVKNHLQAVFRKLDVYNRVQAIAKVGAVANIAHPVNFPPVCRAIKQLF
ncbi:MAG: transcriptional regulator EpsA [Nitrosomonas oligotropha]|uniref:Transcriptional regulator EpsA n=1 Tax=Nitrosomonas oligotropha TaxID=42354 RepID=A0A5C7W2B8_9PROT|nr:MAG: transcriptional regulator EpsA [Nitrosomonas oligotropha]